MTGNFCSQQEITPVSPLDAVATLISELGLDTFTNNSDGATTPAIDATPTSLLVLQGTDSNLSSSQSQQAATLIPINTITFPPTSTTTLQPPTATNTPIPPTNTPVPIEPTEDNNKCLPGKPEGHPHYCTPTPVR
jgi:hypothetical protein